jgi:hypothetical protein
MQKQLSTRVCSLVALAAAILIVVPACEKPPAAAPNATPTKESPPSLEIRPEGPAKIGEPAIVGRDADSFASYIHFPKNAAPASESAVQFYCDVSAEGAVLATYGLIGNDPAFKSAVQSALDWGKFKPAKLDGKPVPVYLGGTVLFFHQGGQPVIVVSLATAERERVGKLANYLQPQLIGGLADRLQRANSTLMWNRPWTGAAEVLFKVGGRGQTDSSSVISEIPKDSGLGELLRTITQDAQWVPAYNDGKPTAGQINVVVNFGEY